MRKQTVILDTIVKTLDNMQAGFDKRFDSIQKNMDDLQSSVELLISSALTRDECSKMIDEKLERTESQLISYMEGFMGDVRNVKEEVLAHDYRIGRLETFAGLER